MMQGILTRFREKEMQRKECRGGTGADARILGCVERVCRLYSGSEELAGLLDVTYTVHPRLEAGELRLDIRFCFDVPSWRRATVYESKCVDNHIREYCRNFPVSDLRAALTEAMRTDAVADSIPPICHHKSVKLKRR